MRSVVLLAVIGAFLVARSAAGPIRPVAQPTTEPKSEISNNAYVFVRLLFQGHDQPNFDKWHANATAATVAKAAGVPVNYLIRLVDGKLPSSKEPAAAKPVPTGPTGTTPATAPPATPAAPGQLPAAAAPTPVATPVPVATPTAAPVPLSTPTAAPKPAPQSPSAVNIGPQVTLITSPTTTPSQPDQKAVKTTPESGTGHLEEAQQVPVQRLRSRVFVIGGRRLKGTSQVIAPDQALVEYAIKTNASEPWAVRETVKRKLMASAANFGMAQGTALKGFYTLLRENGVMYYPSMWVDGEQILAGQVAMEAPPNRFVNGTKNDFKHKLYKHSDLVKEKTPKAANATNVTVAEPSFVMANRSTATQTISTSKEAPKRSGLAPWVVALIALGGVAVAVALGASVHRCIRDRKKRREQEAEAAEQTEPLSPHVNM